MKLLKRILLIDLPIFAFIGGIVAVIICYQTEKDLKEIQKLVTRNIEIQNTYNIEMAKAIDKLETHFKPIIYYRNPAKENSK